MRSTHRLRNVTLSLVLVAGAVGCSSGGKGSGGDAGSPIAGAALGTRLDQLPVEALTDLETAGLVRMRQEELLARDVYIALGATYDLKVFANISAAEQTHADAVLALLERHGVDDPASGRAPGSFADATLQSLYDDLIGKGSASLVDALAVGATVEEIDIVDLQERATDTADIALVYAELEKGSRNHLRAFVRQLDQRGASYAPTALDDATYDQIISTPTERGTMG